MSRATTSTICRAKDRSSCRYHGSLQRLQSSMRKAEKAGNFIAYETARNALEVLHRDADMLELLEEKQQQLRTVAPAHRRWFSTRNGNDAVGDALNASVADGDRWNVDTENTRDVNGDLEITLTYTAALDERTPLGELAGDPDGARMNEALEGHTSLTRVEAGQIAAALNHAAHREVWRSDNPTVDSAGVDASFRQAIIKNLSLVRSQGDDPVGEHVHIKSRVQPFDLYDADSVLWEWDNRS